ncbi:hypothetical protein [Neptuniibacter sp. QD37_11]|uniref:hypothetical protein n=1 Tax=Neptuniibacter sp. QD37_11 TaxID=3398209 RepID=UPI0039F5C208
MCESSSGMQSIVEYLNDNEIDKVEYFLGCIDYDGCVRLRRRDNSKEPRECIKDLDFHYFLVGFNQVNGTNYWLPDHYFNPSVSRF